MEWYDFVLYDAFATIIAAVFIPEADPVSALLSAFAVFGVAFLARPAGALLFAHYGDRLGRRRALAASILLMAVATAVIGLLPGYGSIGWLAPALLVLLRAGQGVAVGGEYGGSAVFVVEYAPADRRGWYGGWQWATVALGLVGLWIRLRTDETPGFRAVQRLDAAARTPLADTLRTSRRSVVVGFGIVAAVAATFNIAFVFLPSHLVTTGRAPLAQALAAALVGLLVAAPPRRSPAGSPTGRVAGRRCSPVASPSWSSWCR